MTSDQVQVVLIAAGWSAAVGVVGLALGWATRRRSVRWLVLLATVVGVTAVVAGVLGTARAMFLSVHDFQVVLLVCLVAGLLALASAWAVAAAIIRSSRALRDAARRFGDVGTYPGADVGPAELQEVSGELARTSDRLEAGRRRERQLEAARRDLVSWVAHDLRTPLAGLRAMTEALEDGLAADPSLYHARMRSEVDRMTRMVEDLFELSRIHAGVLTLAPERVVLRDVVSEVLASADPVARSVGVDLGGSVAETVTVQADPAGLSRVVTNLVMNAVRHSPAAGEVRVRGRLADGDGTPFVELTVSDACGGIPDEDLPRVFDVAWRGSAARTPAASVGGAGAGLGLAIVRGLVEAHQGEVTVVNQPPGCCFTVRLPAA